MLSTIVARVLPEPSSGRAIGELVSQQSAAYNEAVTRLNRGIFIPKRSSRTNPKGLNKLLTEWCHEETYRRRIPYSIHQAGWEQAWEANERMREESARRLSRIARCHEEGKPVKKRDAKPHRRTLAHRERKNNPALTITEGRMLKAKGHTITLEHRRYGFAIKTTAQHLDLLDIRSMQFVPRYHYTARVPFEEREYLMKLQVSVPGGFPAALPEVTSADQILGFDRGRKKLAASSNGMEVRYDLAGELAERKGDWKRVKAKKRGSKRRMHAHQRASLRSRLRRERRKKVKRDQVKVIFREPEPLAVAVENIRLPNLLASAAGTEKHPGVKVSAKRSLNRSVSEAGMGETNRIIRRECERAGVPFLPVSAAGTSQTCTRCGYRNPENRESQAVFLCKSCGFRDNADFSAARIVGNRAYIAYFNEVATVKECPTGWPEQPPQGHGKIPLFRGQSEIKPKGDATESGQRTRVRHPKPTVTQLRLPLVALRRCLHQQD